MKEEIFELILHAGNSKSSSMEAIEIARNGNFEEVEKKLQDAQEELNQAHTIQTQFLFKESKGIDMNPDILMVHAQDHLTAAMVHLDLAKEIINLYRAVSELKEMMKGV